MEDDIYSRLVQAGIRYVSFRPRSEKEMRLYLSQKLAKWNVPDSESLDKVIGRLRELQYVDDDAFATWWIEQRTSYRPKGARVIAQELKSKGVARDVFEEKLNEYHEFDQALALARKKVPHWQKLPTLERKKKLYMFLGTRGFTHQVIGRVIDELA